METPKNKPKAPGARPVSPPKIPAPANAASARPAPASVKVPPLFRKIDWITLLIAFGVVWVTYFLTLAPEVTLEDSGELCTGAFYAGIPHPPGYPFWSIYSWVWTELLRVGNVAWRVEVGESFAAAMGCGLVALMVSRGSSMLMESISDFKGITGRTESLICMVSGVAVAITFGLGYGMWSESVAINRISLFGVPWVMLVMLCLMRWIYAPHQYRYLFFGMFIFGICSTIHQTLLCAGLGIEFAIAFANRRLARFMFLVNVAGIIGGIIFKLSNATDALNVAQELLNIYLAVGLISVVSYIVLAILTKEGFEEFCLDASIAAFILFLVEYKIHHGIFILLALAALGSCIYFAAVTWKLGHEWLPAGICGLLVMLGASFYLYEAISGMTNPPMEWGYPRTVAGFWHALSRGQYDQAHPTDVLGNPAHFIMQLGLLASGIAEEYNWVLLLLAVVPFFYLFKMQKREQGWLIGVSAIYLCVGVLLVILMNPSDDKGSVDLHRVFFTSSHGVIGILIGYGLALTLAFMVANYQRFRAIVPWMTGVLLLPALMALYGGVSDTYFAGANVEDYQYRFLLVLLIVGAFVTAALGGRALLRSREPQDVTDADPKVAAGFFLGGSGLCLLSAFYVAFFFTGSASQTRLSQNVGLFKVLAELPRALGPKLANMPALAGLLIMCIAVGFLLVLLLRRERPPLMITLGLFALMPVASGMSHWAACEQRGHWGGYWFGHDMFTPPVVAPDGTLSYDSSLRQKLLQGTNGYLTYPEMTPGTILFGGTDPGRFCPTYMIFCESFIPHKDQPVQDQNFDRRDVYIITQNALADDTYMEYVRAQYNRSQQVDPPFFQELLRSKEEVAGGYKTNALARLAYRLLDKPLTAMGAKVEARRRSEGVYPPKEIYIPSGEDMQKAFSDYMQDAQRRYLHDSDPSKAGEPRQLKQGEIASPAPDGRVSISGQTSVMEINGLLTKVIFDQNPTNDFYVEESFPLDWMFPHLSPFGVIMHINREELPQVTDQMVKRDHEFWSAYSQRLSGNWITYDTTVQQVADFVDKVYIQHDYTGFNGDRRFIRDQQAQKSFSKLRTAIAGIYAWRLGILVGTPTPQKFVATNPEERARMTKEADFAYRQAFAFCPFSPEVVFRYVQFLANQGRYDDARIVAATCLKFDPNNEGIDSIVKQLTPTTSANNPGSQGLAALRAMEKKVQDNPMDFSDALALAQAYLQLHQTAQAGAVLEKIIANPKADATVVTTAAGLSESMQDYPRLEAAIKRLTEIQPDIPERWFDLAKLEAYRSKPQESLSALTRAIQQSDARLTTNTNALNLRQKALEDPFFASLSNQPGFQQLVAPRK